jgi:NAD(P)-dependent dehydrogenase (short-subunit alcohol dehydrogenase family)
MWRSRTATETWWPPTKCSKRYMRSRSIPMAEDNFTGKVVIVTGGGSGIGTAAAHRFAAEGATVVIIGRTQAKLDKVVSDAPTGSTLIALVGDVSDEGEITELVDAVAHDHGRLDTLVNNAATCEPLGSVSDIDARGWRHVMSTDVDGVFFASRAALPHLRAVGGSIVNVGSVLPLVAWRPEPERWLGRGRTKTPVRSGVPCRGGADRQGDRQAGRAGSA